MVSVNVELPDGWELADNKIRDPRPGEWYWSPNMNGPNLATECYQSRNRIIVRKSWQWPAWLKARYLFQTGNGVWHASCNRPALCDLGVGKRWVFCGPCIQLDCGRMFDFDPPECDDWTTSLRENPEYQQDN